MNSGVKNFFSKLSIDAPLAEGPNVFLTREYEKFLGLSRAQTNVRLTKLIAEGKVRRVRTLRGGKVVSALEYIEKVSPCAIRPPKKKKSSGLP